jgi:hypothetical protein
VPPLCRCIKREQTRLQETWSLFDVILFCFHISVGYLMTLSAVIVTGVRGCICTENWEGWRSRRVWPVLTWYSHGMAGEVGACGQYCPGILMGWRGESHEREFE